MISFVDKFILGDKDTGLQKMLKDKGITTVIPVGARAQWRRLYTAVAAALRGFNVIVPVDGMSGDGNNAYERSGRAYTLTTFGRFIQGNADPHRHDQVLACGFEALTSKFIIGEAANWRPPCFRASQSACCGSKVQPSELHLMSETAFETALAARTARDARRLHALRQMRGNLPDDAARPASAMPRRKR